MTPSVRDARSRSDLDAAGVIEQLVTIMVLLKVRRELGTDPVRHRRTRKLAIAPSPPEGSNDLREERTPRHVTKAVGRDDVDNRA